MNAMKRTRPQFNRLVELDRRIKAGKYPNCLTFSAEWESSQKTIQRDIDYLRDVLGAPIEYDREKNGYFYTDDHWFLPSVSLSEGELVATLLAARALEQYAGTPVAGDLERIVGKLADLLPERISMRPEWMAGRFTFQGPPAKAVDPAIWTEVIRGLLHQRSVKITYQAMEAPKPGERVIDPYHIANLSGEWYMFACCHKKGMVTQFAIPRISKAAVTERGFEVPDDFDPKTYLAAAFARFASGERPAEVRLLFTAEVATWVAEREWHPSQRLRKRKTGEIEMSFKTTGLFEVLRWVLSWGSAVEVLAPAALRKDVADEIRRMARRRSTGTT
jgi:proteasome accessory factor B